MKRKIAAIFAADAVGYSRLVAEDEDDALTRLAEARKVMDGIIAKMNGRIFNTAGDAVLAEFPSAVDAVRCAIGIQTALKTWNEGNPPARRMPFRIGVTIGDVVEDGEDLLGDAVNVAARLQSLTEPGSICVSRSVQEAVNNKVGARLTDLGLKQLKNIPEPVRVYAIETDHGEAVVSVPKAAPAPPNWGKPAAAVAGALVVAAGLFVLIREPEAPEAPAVAEAAPVEVVPDPAPAAPEVAAAPAPAPEVTAVPAPVNDAGTDNTSTESAPNDRPLSKEPEKVVRLDPLAAQTILPRALRECLNGDIKTIRQDCQLVLDNSLVTGRELASVELRLGQALRANRQPDDAIRAYDRAIRAFPTAEAYNQRGIAHYDKKEWDNAISDYTEAVRLDPQNAEALNNRAWTKYIAGRFSEALMDADAALRITREKSYVWDTRGHINEALGQTQAAVSDYRKAIDLDPNLKSSLEGLERLGAGTP